MLSLGIGELIIIGTVILGGLGLITLPVVVVVVLLRKRGSDYRGDRGSR